MGSKKKTKANKLARMSEEERLRYLQHRAAMEEEAQRRKQELITTYLTTKLKHEEAFTRLNSAKINQQWRHILRQIKCKELKEDTETLKQRYEIVLQCKNKVIETLLQDFDRAEFQHSLQFKAHVETISKFFDIHRTSMTELHDWYVKQLQNILTRSAENKTKFLTEEVSDREKIKTTRNIENNHAEKNLCKMKEKFDEKKSDRQTRLLYKMTKLEDKYADELKELKQKYGMILSQYKNNTETKHAHYKILAENDNFDSLQIIRHFEEISTYTQRIHQTKIELEDLENKNCKEIEFLQKEKERINRRLQELQKLNNQNVANDRMRLKMLVNVSNRVIKDFSALFKLGNKLIHLSDSCSKLNKGESSEPQSTKLDQYTQNEASQSFDKLQQFWKNYNEAKISNETLKEKKSCAIAENEKLKKLLRFYMTTVRRSSSVPRKCGF